MDSHDLAEAILSRLPAYKVSLSIDHNDHKTCYETVAQFIDSEQSPDFQSPEARQQCIDTNELWTMQWYPNTPVGHNYIGAPTLQSLLTHASTLQ